MTDYQKGEWEMFCLITSAEYGKERFFLQKNGTVYDRDREDYLADTDKAIIRFLNEIKRV